MWLLLRLPLPNVPLTDFIQKECLDHSVKSQKLVLSHILCWSIRPLLLVLPWIYSQVAMGVRALGEA